MENSTYRPKLSGHALVLGGSGGIGAEIVRALIANGISSVSFTYGKNRQKAEDLAEEIRSNGVNAYFESIDQSSPESFSMFLERAVKNIGEEINIGINSVGISPNIPLEKQTLDGDDGWRNVFEVNVFGCFVSTRALAERMKSKGIKGSIVLITSTNGINSQSSISAHYDASKAAQGHLMKILAEEYAPSIRINGVAPGWIDTSMNDSLPADERKKEMQRIWSKRFADPIEIAKFVAFIAGDGGSYAYGQNFILDGGYR